MTDYQTNGCECAVCQNNRAHAKHLLNIPESERPFFENVYDDLLNTKFDLDYYKAIMDGSWPSSVSILEEAIKRAKAKQQERNTDASA